MRLDSTRQRIAAGSDKQKSNYSASNCCNFHGSITDPPLTHTSNAFPAQFWYSPLGSYGHSSRCASVSRTACGCTRHNRLAGYPSQLASCLLAPSHYPSLSPLPSLCVCVKYANVLPNLIGRCYPACIGSSSSSSEATTFSLSLSPPSRYAPGGWVSFQYALAACHASFPFVRLPPIPSLLGRKQGNSILHFSVKLFTYCWPFLRQHCLCDTL